MSKEEIRMVEDRMLGELAKATGETMAWFERLTSERVGEHGRILDNQIAIMNALSYMMIRR